MVGDGDRGGWIIVRVGEDVDRGVNEEVGHKDKGVVKVYLVGGGVQTIHQGVKVNGSHWYVMYLSKEQM